MAITTSNIKRVWRWLRPARLFSIILALWTLVTLALLGSIFVYSRMDRAQPADVMVILGAGLQGPDDRPGPALVRRTAKGADLWRRGLAEQIICSGGVGINRARSEADACAELLRGLGVPDSAILLEEQSRSTEENALYTLEVMQAHGWETALLVSDGYHLLRAHWIFSNTGIPNSTSPADDPPLDNLMLSSIREIIAFHWLAFKTLFNIPVTYVPII
jgi:uncharacterized SAM-binding protein YcdF (DUF218 family)